MVMVELTTILNVFAGEAMSSRTTWKTLPNGPTFRSISVFGAAMLFAIQRLKLLLTTGWRQAMKSAGRSEKTSLVPAANETAEPALLLARITSRLRVVPELVYVPIPTSQAPFVVSEMQ